MVWDFAEVNPLSAIGGSFSASVGIVASALQGCVPEGRTGITAQSDAVRTDFGNDSLVSTDPPYYDNIGYADLSDFSMFGFAVHCAMYFPISSRLSLCRRLKS